ncbi:MAG: YifB family Mg chelatase-like AAA ATPase [Candidatus Latescibacteria bacterium]|nr:YifB family Mg chelatase-like AAA ATPase [Candidatus Latescibacterota bacterium]
MLSRTISGAVLGIDAYMVDVEISIDNGLANLSTVGLPDNAVKESTFRVEAAIKHSGFTFPYKRVTINLAPADVRKEGSAFDLPIAIGLLAATEQVDSRLLGQFVLLGELSLDGSLRPVRGVLSMALAARKKGIKGMMVPNENAHEAAMAEGLDVYGVASLSEAASLLDNPGASARSTVDMVALFDNASDYPIDFADVKGQHHVKRAMEVAAAGAHNLILVGPQGSGKTMLATRLPTIMPDLTVDEALEATKIHSVSGLLPPNTPLIATRPFRAPHHTISDAGLIGGGAHPRPGEVSLAHHGVLFLDELPEFKKNVLEVMRQPLEDGSVTIARAAISLTYPARLTLVAAMNPCPCGYYGDNHHDCQCVSPQIQRYMSKVSGPLLDRIDLHVEVPAVPYKDLAGEPTGDSSALIRSRVNETRSRQRHRFKASPKLHCNAHMESQEIRTHCPIDAGSHDLLREAITKLGLSARAYDRILKVSRTIADLEGSDRINSGHVGEAIQYRTLDRALWLS